MDKVPGSPAISTDVYGRMEQLYLIVFYLAFLGHEEAVESSP